MAEQSELPLDRLWTEYGQAFQGVDDLTLARWMAQTLGQLEGRVWRLSHPLVGTYRLVAELGHGRQIWLKRLAIVPAAYTTTDCCRAPLLPLLTRDILESGLVCQHCTATAVPFDDLPTELQSLLRPWATEYGPVHAVAHPDKGERQKAGAYDRALEEAAQKAEKLLAVLGTQIMPKFLEYYPAAIWEDQDECLEVRPEDIVV